MQTVPKISNNKCIQSVAVNEEMFQPKPLTKSNKYIEAFLNTHVPYLLTQLRYNETYDLCRNDYKLLQAKSKKSIKQRSTTLNPQTGYRNATKSRYVSCYSWHPTIPGVYAVCYMSNSNAYQTVNFNEQDEIIIKPEERTDQYGVQYSDDENDSKSWRERPESFKLTEDNYESKMMVLLNKEYVQRMRMLQMAEYENYTEEPVLDELRKPFVYIQYKGQHSTQSEIPKKIRKSIKRSETTKNSYASENWQDEEANENIGLEETLSEELQNLSINKDQWNEYTKDIEDEFELDEYNLDHSIIECQSVSDKLTDSNDRLKIYDDDDLDDKDEVDVHDSDTDSFFNIWGDDSEWIYGNNLRKTVRKMHRYFNNKYDLKDKEEKLYKLLISEPKYTNRNSKIEAIDEENFKLASDMLKAGDLYRKYKKQQNSTTKRKRKKSPARQKGDYKLILNDDELKDNREENPLAKEQNNPVVIWSIADNIFPKVLKFTTLIINLKIFTLILIFKLRLDSPEEVCCIQFNPKHGNIIVGGLINGQIIVWDITGKLEEVNSQDAAMSEREKSHRKHLWSHMNWYLNVNYNTRIRSAALSSIIESHTSKVTSLQWLHPMTEVTRLGKLVNTPKDKFSDQFFSSSMDGTIKLWDLHSTPVSKSKKPVNAPKPRFGHPDNLNKYKSPFIIYNNRLEPSYSIKVIEPMKSIFSPITAFSFEIPIIKYDFISDLPLTIGKKQYEYVETSLQQEANKLMVVGSMMGQVGVITWEGHETYHQDYKKEDCKSIWWNYVHDGPISCIRRNPFFSNIHVICGGHIVSIWDINYRIGPIWWKRFKEFTTSCLWSRVHPGEFRIAFETGVVEFWDFMMHAHKPYLVSEILSYGAITTLSAPNPLVHYTSKNFKFSKDINELVDFNKNEVICFADSFGALQLYSMEVGENDPNEIDEVDALFKKEIERKKELNNWNEKYKEIFGILGENNVDEFQSVETQMSSTLEPIEEKSETVTSEQNKRKICNEAFTWYLNRRGPLTHLSKMNKLYIERERRHMLDVMMAKKNINETQLEEFINPILKETERKKHIKEDMEKMRLKADKAFRDIVNKLLPPDPNLEFNFENTLPTNDESTRKNNLFEHFRRLIVTDYHVLKEKWNEFISNNPFKIEQENWTRIIDNAERDVKEMIRLNDYSSLENLEIRDMRKKLVKINKNNLNMLDIKDIKNHIEKQQEERRIKNREAKIKQLKSIYHNRFDYIGKTNLLASSQICEDYFDGVEIGEYEGETEDIYGELNDFISSQSTISSRDNSKNLDFLTIPTKNKHSKDSNSLFTHEFDNEYGTFGEMDEQLVFDEQAEAEQINNGDIASISIPSLNYETINEELLK
ncbi:uncharacterized protein LOC126897863 isoform X2 [Daktulosphaira vitifoliae]|uniref:uncharacterized protein LOC126897863 isoform X2 n=1 Tax=Daktulosphaira vitifoliae TaxID=58002 RepID=UPI0021AA2AF8|nr:uncharacterized protein LOC126897863 isoform X2 [Daktulosphaira vitifoliae]